MKSEELIAVLARSGLDDDTYAAAVAAVRSLAVQAAAGRDLAREVAAAESFLPHRAALALGNFLAAA